MPVAVECACGAKFNLKDEFAGKRLKCPKCGGVITAPALAEGTPMGVGSVGVPPALGMPPGTPPPPPLPLPYAAPRGQDPSDLFGRDKFLLRQKHLSISTKYYVWDEQGRTIAFIERPAHVVKNLIALLAALAVGLVLGGGLAWGLVQLAGKNQELQIGLGAVGVLIGLVAAVVVGVVLSAKRHVQFYADEARTKRVLEVTQDTKWQALNAYYTIKTPEGEPIARLRKNYIYNIIRKRWYVTTPPPPGAAPNAEGEMIAVAKEDSILLSLLRRVIGGAIGAMIVTNFIIFRGQTETVIGEFNRKFTLLDRYVLDLTADPGQTLDRRIALALGVMLDTGERR